MHGELCYDSAMLFDGIASYFHKTDWLKELWSMNIGDTVKFIDGLYADEEGARYKVLEINGDRAVIEFICELPIPPQSVAKLDELKVVEATN
jgi:hypothetical protein